VPAFVIGFTSNRPGGSVPNIRHFLKQLLQSHYPLFSVGQIDERLLADLALSCEFLLEGWLATNVTSLTDR
jgi:hypothetical protein